MTYQTVDESSRLSASGPGIVEADFAATHNLLSTLVARYWGQTGPSLTGR